MYLTSFECAVHLGKSCVNATFQKKNQKQRRVELEYVGNFVAKTVWPKAQISFHCKSCVEHSTIWNIFECFILRAVRLSNKLLGQGYVKERWKSSLRKFFGRYGDLTKQYEVPLFRMLHEILEEYQYSDTLHWCGNTPTFDHLLIWILLPNLTFYLIVWGFHRTFATGAASQQRTLTPPDTWSCPTLGLACVLMSRPISPQLVLFPDFRVSNIPRYFCFAFEVISSIRPYGKTWGLLLRWIWIYLISSIIVPLSFWKCS